MTTLRNVGLGEQIISRNPEDILVAYGLGSCLGIGMFDPLTRTAGLAHAVLPEPANNGDSHSTRYVTVAIQQLLDQMIEIGSDPQRIVIRIAGGATMLLSGPDQTAFDIGARNIRAAHQVLERLNLRLANQEIGGNCGRTMRLYVGSGRMTVRVIGSTEHDL